MTTEQKKEITAYLCYPRNYAEGVALYQRYGVNLRLKRQFAIEDTAVIREILFDELRKLAGLSEIEYKALPRLAARLKSGSAPIIADNVEPDIDSPEYAAAPEPMQKMIRFREKYTFLNEPDCPDVLKVLVADMFTAYANYKTAHARLQALGDADTASAVAECEAVVTEYLKNREIWEELEYYREHGTILGKAAKFRDMEATEDLSKITDVDLMGQLRSAGVQESKAKKALETSKAKGEENEKAEAAFEKWSSRKKELKEEMERRKKK